MDQNEFPVHITEVYADQSGYVRERICIMPRRRYFQRIKQSRPIPVAARSKPWVCGSSLAGITGSNPTGDLFVCLL